MQVDILQVLGGVAPFARDLDEQPSNSARHLLSWRSVRASLDLVLARVSCGFSKDLKRMHLTW